MDCYLGEIRIFPFGVVPSGWHLCDGTLLTIQQNQALYALIGITYGGSGTQFALPDLRGRTPVGANLASPNYPLGGKGGAETIVLNGSNIPIHNHVMELANATGNAGIATNRPAIPTTPAGITPAVSASIYSTNISPGTTLAPDTLDVAGGNGAHANMQPFQTINYCIATQGLWPSRP